MPAIPTLPPNPTPEQLAEAYSQGLLRKTLLHDGVYYQGYCRNAEFARWSSALNRFVHVQFELGQRILEDIRHPEDEEKYDVFMALSPVEPEQVPEISRISDEDFHAHITERLAGRA